MTEHDDRLPMHQAVWGEAITTRHRLVHGYDTIDYDVVWDTIADDFPPLVAALVRVLAGEPD